MSSTRRLYDADRHAVLAAVYEKEGTGVNHDGVGAYRTKLVRAGDMIYVSCYPLISIGRLREQDAALKAMKEDGRFRTRLKYAKYNNRRRVEAFEQLAHANFGAGDFHVSCTYDPAGPGIYPSEREAIDREQAKKDVRNYLRRIRRMLARHGCDLQEFRWICVTVTKEHDREAPRPFPDTHHHHLLMHGVPEALRGEAERLWMHGFCNADRLQPNDTGIAEVSGYIARQEGRANGDHAPGEKSFTSSRNLKKPAVTTSDSRISRRRVAQIAADVRANAAEIFAALYPDCRLVEWPRVEMSDFVAGAYIHARLKRTKAQPQRRGGGRRTRE